MQRQIKFRAWFKEKPNWCNQMFYSDEEGSLGGWFSEVQIEQEDVELMQYTGLKDKNDKEIYEGDIFSIPPDKYHFCEERNVVEYGVDGYLLEDHGLHLADYNERGEVIGNIYENPELLEDKSDLPKR